MAISSPLQEESGSTSAAMSPLSEGMHWEVTSRSTVQAAAWTFVKPSAVLQVDLSSTSDLTWRLGETASAGTMGWLVYPLRVEGSELPSLEDNVDRLREVRSDTRFEYVTTCAEVKGRIDEIDVFMHRQENDLGWAPCIF